MSTTQNDWKPETSSLLRRLTKAGFKLVCGRHEHRFTYQNDLQMVTDLTACDESTLCVALTRTDENGKAYEVKYNLWLVFGNSPGELVCDYNVCEELDAVVDAHYTAWEGRKQPLTSDTLKQRQTLHNWINRSI